MQLLRAEHDRKWQTHGEYTGHFKDQAYVITCNNCLNVSAENGTYQVDAIDVWEMLRIHLVQNLYELSDMGTHTEIIDSRAFSEFCGVDSSNQVPNGDTIGRFRSILVEHGLQEKLFGRVVQLLSERGLILKKGTIVDSTLIAAPPSTKNREKQRDPDAHKTKRGNEWHFGYKAHVGRRA